MRYHWADGRIQRFVQKTQMVTRTFHVRGHRHIVLRGSDKRDAGKPFDITLFERVYCYCIFKTMFCNTQTACLLFLTSGLCIYIYI